MGEGARRTPGPRAGLASARRRALGVLRRAESFLLLLHESPDGDSVGSTLGLALGLGRLKKRVVTAGVDPLPEQYRFLPGADLVQPWPQVGGSYDAAVLIDCGDLARVGPPQRVREAARLVLNIDHHPTNTGFGDINLVDPAAPAAGGIVYDLLRGLRVDPTAEMATCLYAALLTDTGSFRYENTSAPALALGAELVRLGADPGLVAMEVYETKPLSHLRLLQGALKTLRTSPDGRVAWMRVTPGMMAEAGATDGETEGLVNYARMVEGAEVGILFREVGGGRVKISLRSRRHVDVGRLAAEFGGGGHARAAGFWLAGDLAQVEGLVLGRVGQELAGRGGGA
ncbi:MAG: bifunctional oligoribonuclease/PAP phosphatase NrnA [Acetobacteraceae bacterium]|nr:bifunctional oligoribonuclease/PAP phosphatase NrnA [Acetobacteraceae bacterium]